MEYLAKQAEGFIQAIRVLKVNLILADQAAEIPTAMRDYLRREFVWLAELMRPPE